MTMLRLLFVGANETAPWGASETTWTSLAARLASRRQADVWVSVKWWPEMSPRISALASAGCRMTWRAPDPVLRAAHELPFGERNAGVLDVARPSLVVISQGDNWEGLGWMAECARRNLPYIVISNSASEYEWPDDELAEQLAGGYLGACRAYFVSQANIRLTELQIGVRLSNAAITPVPYQVPFDASPPWPEEESSLRLACVARLNPMSKGHDVLFEALSLDKWRQRPVTVTLFGEGAHKGVLERLIALLDLRSITFGGHVKDIVGIWRTHHALVLPSRDEGFPTVIVEAALCGRPSVVTNVAGNTVLVKEGLTGYVAESPTAVALDRALEQLWDDRANLAKLGAQARVLARSCIPPDPTAALIADLDDILRQIPTSETVVR